MNIMILAAASFIGTNLTVKLAKNKNDRITVVDKMLIIFLLLTSIIFQMLTLKYRR